jgi:hypothetical protein
MFHRRVHNTQYQKDEGLQFIGMENKQIIQQQQVYLIKKNEGILFTGFPSSRPLHIHRKTGTSSVVNLSNSAICNEECSVPNIKWKMLGKNTFQYLNNASCGTCKAPSTVPKKPYYYDRLTYLKRKCSDDTPPYSIVKNNNKYFDRWGPLDASNLTLRKKYDAILKNNKSLMVNYNRRFNYSEVPIPVLTILNLKQSPSLLCECE